MLAPAGSFARVDKRVILRRTLKMQPSAIDDNAEREMGFRETSTVVMAGDHGGLNGGRWSVPRVKTPETTQFSRLGLRVLSAPGRAFDEAQAGETTPCHSPDVQFQVLGRA